MNTKFIRLFMSTKFSYKITAVKRSINVYILAIYFGA